MDESHYFHTDLYKRTDLNRSFSAPDIQTCYYKRRDVSLNGFSFLGGDHCGKVVVTREIIQTDQDSPRILRQYSYQEIHCQSLPLIRPSAFNKFALTQQVSSTDYKNSNVLNNLAIVDINHAQGEAMDVDSSLNYSDDEQKIPVIEHRDDKVSTRDMESHEEDVIHRRRTKHRNQDRKRRSAPTLDKIVKKERREPPLFMKTILAVIIITATLFLGAYMLFDYTAQVDLDGLGKELTEQVHEQKDAVRAVLNSLNYDHQHARWHKSVKVLNFVGRSGVGKTLIANIVKVNFNSFFVSDLHSSQLEDATVVESVFGNLFSRFLNLIIIDDLTVEHLDSLVGFMERLEDKDAMVLVIAIFSIQKVDDKLNSNVYYEDISLIHKKFDKTEIYHEVIVFDEFSIADVREYLGKHLRSHEVDVEYHNKISNRVLEDHDVYHNGFKQLHAKVLSAINQFNLS